MIIVSETATNQCVASSIRLPKDAAKISRTIKMRPPLFAATAAFAVEAEKETLSVAGLILVKSIVLDSLRKSTLFRRARFVP